MKNKAFEAFSLKDKSKKLKCCLLQFLFGTLRVKSRLSASHKSKLFFSSKIKNMI